MPSVVAPPRGPRSAVGLGPAAGEERGTGNTGYVRLLATRPPDGDEQGEEDGRRKEERRADKQIRREGSPGGGAISEAAWKSGHSCDTERRCTSFGLGICGGRILRANVEI